MVSPNLRAPLIAEGQAQPHVTANEVTVLADLARPRLVLSATTSTPPASPAEGAAYILPAGSSGWPSSDGNDPAAGDIAIRWAGAWHRIAPAIGWRWLVLDQGRALIYTAAGWRAGDVAGDLGSTLGLATIESLADLSGASVSVADLIPTRAIVLGVSSWTVEAVTGATSYQVGLSGEVDKFGGSLDVTPGASNIGVIGPLATYAPADVIITAQGGAFTGGKVALAVSAILPGVPL